MILNNLIDIHDFSMRTKQVCGGKLGLLGDIALVTLVGPSKYPITRTLWYMLLCFS